MWSDRETENDCLGFASYVSTLSDICLEKSLAPLTLGVFGSWGSGKTSLMHMLKKHVDGLGEQKVCTLWFNAWRYEGRDEAQSALIHAILRRIEEDKTLTEDVKLTLGKLKKSASVLKLAKFITKTAVTLTPDFAGLADCFADESSKLAETMEAFEQEFERLLKCIDVERILVFIDDLDRCKSEKVLETFETIKLFLNIPQCTFVIGADSNKIEQAVAGSFNVEAKPAAFARDYLEKIVQMPFRIPEQRMRDIACYVGMLILGLHLNERGWAQLVQDREKLLPKATSNEHEFTPWCLANKSCFRDANYAEPISNIESVMPHVQTLARGLKGNPRQIKRFMNILGLRTRLGQATGQKVKRELLIKLLVLEYTWPDFFAEMSETLDDETGWSYLLTELLGEPGGTTEAEGDSKLLSDARDTTGLLEFLNDEPELKGVDLRPYLFLAQTSLNRESTSLITPLDEVARKIALDVRSPDQIRAKAAARKAVNQDAAVVASIVRLLVADLATVKEDSDRARILSGLHPVCTKHTALLPVVVKGLESVSSTKNDGVNLAATSLFTLAQKSNVEIPEGLPARFKSKVSEALAAPARKKG